MSVAVDFGIPRVVDGNWGVRAILEKSMFCRTARPSEREAGVTAIAAREEALRASAKALAGRPESADARRGA